MLVIPVFSKLLAYDQHADFGRDDVQKLSSKLFRGASNAPDLAKLHLTLLEDSLKAMLHNLLFLRSLGVEQSSGSCNVSCQVLPIDHGRCGKQILEQKIDTKIKEIVKAVANNKLPEGDIVTLTFFRAGTVAWENWSINFQFKNVLGLPKIEVDK